MGLEPITLTNVKSALVPYAIARYIQTMSKATSLIWISQF